MKKSSLNLRKDWVYEIKLTNIFDSATAEKVAREVAEKTGFEVELRVCRLNWVRTYIQPKKLKA